MISIAYDYQIFSIAVYGGVARYFLETANRIQQSGDFDVKILAGFHINRFLAEYPSDIALGRYIKRLPKETAVVRCSINRWLNSWWMNSHKPEIVHETLFTESSVSPPDSKIVITVYDMIPERFHELPGRDESIRIKKESIKRADHIICISNRTKDDLLEFVDIQPSKVSTIHLASSFAATKLSPRIKNVKPYILYVGQRRFYKNVKVFLTAYASSERINRDFDLVCFGAGSIKADEYKIMRMHNIPNEKIIHVAGNDEVLKNLYRNASLFAFPSLYEGFGIPILEAMSQNCPVVCSNASCFPEIAGSAALYFNPEEPEDIAVAMEKVLYSEQLTEELIERGKERVSNFSWDKTAQETINVYNNLI